MFLSRNHVVSDEYLPSPYFGFVEFCVTLEFIVCDVNNRRRRFGFGIEDKQTSRSFQFKIFFADISFTLRVRSNKTREAFSKSLSI